MRNEQVDTGSRVLTRQRAPQPGRARLGSPAVAGSLLVVAALAAGILVATVSLPARAQNCEGTSTGLTPITELTAGDWLGHRGGLYPEAKNDPSEAHAAAALAAGRQAAPLNEAGEPSSDGRIVLLSIGMSNTTQEFSEFVRLSAADPQMSEHVVVVDGAQGGQTAADIADSGAQFWSRVDQRLDQAGVSTAQVQFVWLKEANRGPTGPADAYAEALKADLADVVRVLTDRFPNLRIAYLSSRIYAGYATTTLNPEPYAYASGFAVKWLIEDQIEGDPSLNWDPDRGPAQAPLLLWGPYLWADGLTPRVGDGLVWECDDFANDGTHPAADARYKVATMLLGFMKTDPTAKLWFLADPDATPAASPTQGPTQVPTRRPTRETGPTSTPGPTGQPSTVSLRLRETPSGDAFWLTTDDPLVQRRAGELRPGRPAWLCAGVTADPEAEWGFSFDGDQARLMRQPVDGRDTTVRTISEDPAAFDDGPACVQVGELLDELPGVPPTPTPGTPEPTATPGTPEPTATPGTQEPTATDDGNGDRRLLLPALYVNA